MRRAGRWLLRIFAVAALAAAVAGLIFIDYPQASYELPEAFHEYRAEGLPWLAKEIAGTPPPDHQNAAALLRKAIAALPEDKLDYNPAGNIPYGTVPSLAPFNQAIALAHEAGKRPRLDFRRDWDLGAFVQFPEEAGIKALTRLLTARAELRSRERDDLGALADLDAARRLAQLVAQDHGIIPALVAAACENMVSGQARSCLAKAANDPRRLAIYRDWLAKPAPLVDLHRAFRAEIFQTVATARNLDRMGIGTSWNPMDDCSPFVCHYPNDEPPAPEPTSENVRRDGLPKGMRSRAYLARCLQMWTQLSQETNGFKGRFDAISERSDSILLHSSWPPTASHIFDSVLFPVFAQFGRSNHRILANRTLALAYADALIHHAKTGRWPATCSVPDPLGDGYLRTRFDNGRFRIWSVGNDGRDGNGLVRDEVKLGRSSDDLVAAHPPFPPYKPKPLATNRK